jgi:hypothetical protein
MEKQEKEPTIKEPLRVNIIKDSKQMRVTIPAQIVEEFRIDPEKLQFAWYVEELGKDKEGKSIVTVRGSFIGKNKDDKKE